MCSKTNPPEAEKCSFCGARLKPILPGQEEEAGSSPAGPASDEPDWLLGLRSENQSSSEPGQEGGAGQSQQDSGSDVEPDWLSRIRDRARLESGEAEQAREDEEAADWIREIAGRAKVELSGGITLENVRAYADAGANAGADARAWRRTFVTRPLRSPDSPAFPRGTPRA